MEVPFTAYVSHPSALMGLVRSWQESVQRRFEGRLVLDNPFYDLESEEEMRADRELVKARRKGDSIEYPEGFGERIVRRNVGGIARNEGLVSFVNSSSLWNTAEMVYANLVSSSPIVAICTSRMHNNPWLTFHNDEVFFAEEDFERVWKERIEDGWRESPRLGQVRKYLWGLFDHPIRLKKENKMRLYLAHSTLGRFEVRKWQEEFEKRHPFVKLVNPYFDVPEGELDLAYIRGIEKGERANYPENFDRVVVFKDVDVIRHRVDGILAIHDDHDTIGKTHEIVYGNLMGKSPIITVYSKTYRQHPWNDYHSDHVFRSLDEIDVGINAITDRFFEGAENERLRKHREWVATLRAAR
jgi:hypothetical protein